MSFPLRLTFEDLLFVSYAVPPARVRPLVPPAFVLDTIEDSSGEPFALVSAVAFRTRRAEPSIGFPLSLDAPQLNLRTYVKPSGRAAYFLRVELGVRPLGMLGEIALRGAAATPMALEADYDEASASYRAYAVRCNSPAGKISLDVVQVGARVEEQVGARAEENMPPPVGFPSWEAAAAFVAERPVGYLSSTLGGYLRLDVEHVPLRPAVGQLVEGRLRSLERLGILTREESARPHSVFLKRRAVFSVRLPRPIFSPSGLSD